MSKIILSVDDGCQSDIRVAELAENYDLDCTFYWPVNWITYAYKKGFEPLTWTQARQIARDHSIGSHGISHLRLTRIPTDAAKAEIKDSQVMLSRLFNQNINSFCPARGYTNPELTEYTLRFYEHQRLTVGWDGEYKLVHVHPKSGVNDDKDWKEYAKDYDKVHLWMHSHELDEYGLWNELEEFISENSPS